MNTRWVSRWLFRVFVSALLGRFIGRWWFCGRRWTVRSIGWCRPKVRGSRWICSVGNIKKKRKKEALNERAGYERIECWYLDVLRRAERDATAEESLHEFAYQLPASDGQVARLILHLCVTNTSTMNNRRKGIGQSKYDAFNWRRKTHIHRERERERLLRSRSTLTQDVGREAPKTN